MATSVLEQIAVKVFTILRDYDAYAYPVEVVRVAAKNEPKHLRAILYQLEEERVEDGATMTDEWHQFFAVVAYFMPKETDNTAIDTYMNAVRSGLYAAIMADVRLGFGTTGPVVNTEVLPSLRFPPMEGEFAGITFNFKVHYRNQIDDPDTAGAG